MVISLEKKLDYQFRNEDFLRRALTHRSHAADHNERYEFLGDALLELIISNDLFLRFPDADEGLLTRLRSHLVKKETLAEVARELQLGEQLKLGSGEMKSGGHRRDSILADALESIIAAIYLDSDIECCRQVVLRWFADKLQSLSPELSFKDPKTRLQEYLQSQGLPLPIYSVAETTGEGHAQVFVISCCVESLDIKAQGSGTSRRKAEQEAAARCLDALPEVDAT